MSPELAIGAFATWMKVLGFLMFLPFSAQFAVVTKSTLSLVFASLIFFSNPLASTWYSIPISFLSGFLLSLPMLLLLILGEYLILLFENARGMNVSANYGADVDSQVSGLVFLGRLVLWMLILEHGIFTENLCALFVSTPVSELNLGMLQDEIKTFITLFSSLFQKALLAMIPCLLCFTLVEVCIGVLQVNVPRAAFMMESLAGKISLGAVALYLLLRQEPVLLLSRVMGGVN